MLVNYHIGRLVLSSLCVRAFDAAGFRRCSFCRLKHYCSIRVVCGGWGLMTEQDDRCGNSLTQSQAPEDGYINVRNMLSA